MLRCNLLPFPRFVILASDNTLNKINAVYFDNRAEADTLQHNTN